MFWLDTFASSSLRLFRLNFEFAVFIVLKVVIVSLSNEPKTCSECPLEAKFLVIDYFDLVPDLRLSRKLWFACH